MTNGANPDSRLLNQNKQHKRAYNGMQMQDEDDATYRRYHENGKFGFNVMKYGSPQQHNAMNNDVDAWNDPNPWGQDEPCIPYDEYKKKPQQQ